jgi:NADP-dependent 3-hydroxy acid dehydrogenase YdfG
MKKTVIITGTSSGMGKATALQLIEEGHIVYGAARRVENMAELVDKGGHALKMDVTNDKSVQQAVEKVIREQGRIDVLVNNAGYAVYGSVEDVSMGDARRQFDVNIFGLARLTQMALPHMRKQNSGKIYTPLGAWYHGTHRAFLSTHHDGKQYGRWQAVGQRSLKLDIRAGSCICHPGYRYKSIFP